MEMLSKLDSGLRGRHAAGSAVGGDGAQGFIMTEDSHRSFSIGKIFSRAFGVMGRNPLVAFGVTFLLSALPGALFNYGFAQLHLDMRDRNTMLGAIGSGIIAFAVALLLRALVQGCLVRATIADSQGRRAGLDECLKVAMARALPLIGVSFLFVIGLMVGMILLIVPGIMFAAAYAVVAPVVVEERVGVIEAFRRTSQLTRGARWKIFGLGLLILVAIWLIEAVVGVIAIVLFQQGYDPFSLSILLFNILVGTIVATFSSTIQTALYVELREWKDGPIDAKLSEIFE